jgi:RNA polymerase sigma-70 factor, ECF subfamily
MPISESEIIDKAAAGDVHSFRTLVEKHQVFVLRLAYRFVRNTQDAEDITQEAFIRLWKNLNKYRPGIKLSTWMYTIVTNLCLDYLKSSRFAGARKSAPIDDRMKIASPASTDMGMVQDEMRAIIIKLSEELTPKQKAAFVLRDLEELEVEEVCTILNDSAANIKSNLYHARQKMSEMIQKYYKANKNELL